MAAAGNHKSHQLHCAETFYLTNMAPQVGSGFNRDSWNRLEKHVRHLTKQYSNVYVCTGPLYLPRKENDGKTYVKYQVIGSNSVAVPTHFYKIIVGETANQRYDLEAYVMPNQKIDDNTPLNVFQVNNSNCCVFVFPHIRDCITVQWNYIYFIWFGFRCPQNQLNVLLDYCFSIKLRKNNCKR